MKASAITVTPIVRVGVTTLAAAVTRAETNYRPKRRALGSTSSSETSTSRASKLTRRCRRRSLRHQIRLFNLVRFQKQFPERAQVQAAGRDVALQFFDAVVDSLRESIDLHLRRNQFAEDVQESFGFAFCRPFQIADKAVFAVPNTFLGQVFTGNAGKIANGFGSEQHSIFEHACSFVVAALLPTGTACPTFFEFTAFFSQAIASSILISII